MNIQKKINIAETVISFVLMSSAALMILITEHNYSTRLLLGILLVSPILIPLRKYKGYRPSTPVKLLWAGNIIVAVFYGIAGIMFRNIAYLLIAATIAVVVPLLQIYVHSRSEEFTDNICFGSLMFAVFFLILSFIAGPPISIEQFGGILFNQNSLGLVCIALFPAGLALCREKKLAAGLVIIGISAAFTFFSTSRTAFLAIFLQLAYALFVIILDVVKKHAVLRDKIKAAVLFALVCVLSCFIMFWLFTSVKAAEAEMFPQLQMENIYGDTLSFDEMYRKFGGHLGKGLDGEGDYSFSSGRIGIWKDYAENLTFLGHEKEERDQVISGTRIYLTTNAHNAYLQLAYGAGIPAGIGLLWISLMAAYGCFKQSIRGLKGSRISNKKYYSILTVLGYGIVSITSSNWMMFVHLPALMFWPMLLCLIEDQELTAE